MMAAQTLTLAFIRNLQTILSMETPQTAVKFLSYLSLPLWTHRQASLEWAEVSPSRRVNKGARANSHSKGHEWTANHSQINSLFNSAYSYLNRAQAESSFCVRARCWNVTQCSRLTVPAVSLCHQINIHFSSTISVSMCVYVWMLFFLAWISPI